MSEQPSIYQRKQREDGSTFVTTPDFPGFSYVLQAGEDNTQMNAIFVQFLAYELRAVRELAAGKHC